MPAPSNRTPLVALGDLKVSGDDLAVRVLAHDICTTVVICAGNLICLFCAKAAKEKLAGS